MSSNSVSERPCDAAHIASRSNAGNGVTVLKDVLHTRNPVCAFPMNQMSYDIEGSPGAGPLVRHNPRFGKVLQ